MMVLSGPHAPPKKKLVVVAMTTGVPPSSRVLFITSPTWKAIDAPSGGEKWSDGVLGAGNRAALQLSHSPNVELPTARAIDAIDERRSIGRDRGNIVHGLCRIGHNGERDHGRPSDAVA